MKSKIFSAILKLQKQGINVSYRKRKDGGYRVLKIDGKKFSNGSLGNKRVLKLTGDKLSAKRIEANRINLRKIKRKSKLPDDFIKQFRRTQRKWRERGLVDKGKGKVSMKDYRWKIEHEGIDEAIKSLKEHERYALGLAYTENINALIDKLNYIDGKLDVKHHPERLNIHEDILYLLEWIKKNGATITEEQIKECFSATYKDAKGHAFKNNDFIALGEGIERVIHILTGKIK